MAGPPVLPNPPPSEDAIHLRQLSIAHYILGGVIALFGTLPIIHVGIGIAMVTGRFPGTAGSQPMPTEAQWTGWFFIAIGGTVVLGSWLLGALMIASGRRLAARRSHLFCFVVSCIQCLCFPLGTTLGVLTIIVLNRPSVRALFRPSPENHTLIPH